MSLDATRAAWAAPVTTAAQRLVLLALAEHCRRGGRVCWPSHARLADLTKLDRKTVQAALRGLSASGAIRDTGERRGDTARVVVYELTNGTVSGSIAQGTKGAVSDPITQTRNGTETAPIRDEVMGPFSPANRPENGPGNRPENGLRNQEVGIGKNQELESGTEPGKRKATENGPIRQAQKQDRPLGAKTTAEKPWNPPPSEVQAQIDALISKHRMPK